MLKIILYAYHEGTAISSRTIEKRRVDTLGETNLLTGLEFCADCGSKMYNHRAKPNVDRQGNMQQ